MCDEECDYLTTGDKEQLYDVFHSQKQLASPQKYFENFCNYYEHVKESNEFSITPVLVDLEMPEQSMTIANFQEGEKPTRINNLQMASWMDTLIEQFPDAIGTLKYT
jgi:hypothetical protein